MPVCVGWQRAWGGREGDTETDGRKKKETTKNTNQRAVREGGLSPRLFLCFFLTEKAKWFVPFSFGGYPEVAAVDTSHFLPSF